MRNMFACIRLLCHLFISTLTKLYCKSSFPGRLFRRLYNMEFMKVVDCLSGNA